MANLLAPGAKAPAYALVRPKGVSSDALWSGTTNPGAGWTGVGGGWYTPPKSIAAQAIAGHPAWATPAPPAPAPPAPAKPTYSATTVTAPAPAPAAPAAPASPLDATYFQNVDANAKTTADTIAGYNKTLANAQNALPTFDYTNAVAAPELAHQHAVDVLAQRLAANRRGALYSTGLGQAIGDVDQTYQDKYTTASKNLQTLQDQIASQILGANDAEGQYDAGQYESAAERASAAAQANPALGMPTTPLVNNQYLIKGGSAAPNYTLTPPKGAPATAKWSGVKPPGNWRGIGGGWWIPTK